ncbi:MAG: ABC transporter substrate-binding protein [Anaerocolumna sp.]
MKKRIISLLMVTAMIAALLSGCQTSKNSMETDNGAGETKEVTVDGQSAENVAETAESTDETKKEVKTGGTLKIGTGQSPTVIGYTPEITNNSFIQYLRCSFDSLLFYDEDGNLAPELAEKWETDSDKATITFHLRQGVKFQDGTDFNAEAVKWNMEEYQTAKRTEVSSIESIECPDDYTVVLQLGAWSSSALESIGYFVYYMSPTAVKDNGGAEWARINAVGTGPYIEKSFEQGVSVKYEKNPNYWEEGKPYLDGIEFSIISDATTLENSLVSGEIDMISYASIDQMHNNYLNSNSSFTIEQNSNGIGVESTGIIPSSAKEDDPFYNDKVRQAFCYAIDADNIVNALGYGLLTRTNQWAAPNAKTYNPEVKGYTYDPDKAKSLLTEAGYADGFDTTLWCPTGSDNWAAAIADNLNAVGIRAKVEIVDAAKAFDLMSNGWEGIFFHWASIGPDLGLYMGRHLDPNGAYYSKGIKHPQDCLDLLTAIRTAKDDESKLSTEMELQKKIYDDYALFGLPLYITPVAAIKQAYVMDDNYTKYHVASWTPARTWLDK